MYVSWKMYTIPVIFKLLFQTNFIMSLIKEYFVKYLSGKCIELSPKYYKIHYPYGVNWYTIIVPRKRGPYRITEIYGFTYSDPEEQLTITKSINKIMGPSHNFHGIPTSPKMLGYKKIIFNNLDDVKKKFVDDEIISV
jgi:hypothetical protein